ncbi:hypothetical protein RRG08_063940 [Elysia crispata]|uniref:Uncharacterized protein n=1 Tax=Elysia crispata TaxID=231223 RepID=A0AAE0YF11_9GAST|nr:hypothetical protein RRG08_063940 [Elysia crispata]
MSRILRFQTCTSVKISSGSAKDCNQPSENAGHGEEYVSTLTLLSRYNGQDLQYWPGSTPGLTGGLGAVLASGWQWTFCKSGKKKEHANNVRGGFKDSEAAIASQAGFNDLNEALLERVNAQGLLLLVRRFWSNILH